MFWGSVGHGLKAHGVVQECTYVCTHAQGQGQKGSVSIKILSTMGGGGTKSSSLR